VIEAESEEEARVKLFEECTDEMLIDGIPIGLGGKFDGDCIVIHGVCEY
jgi:hypothetical protein